MRILYLCSKQFWKNKMSRVRFHSIDAIGRHPEVDLRKDGPGFDGFLDAPTSVKKHSPDVVIWYKPLDIPGYDKVNVPKVLRYNEMWDIRWTSEEITKSKTQYVLCHHANDIPNYKHLTSNGFTLFHNPHCAEKTIFRDYGLKKEYDILLTGVISPTIYPLRSAFHRIMTEKLGNVYKCKVMRHPGYRIQDIKSQVLNYAKEINKAKVVVCCSSKYHYALAKYIEVGMCGTLLCADLPGERQKWYKQWMLTVDPKDSDERIVEKLYIVLKNDALRNRYAKKGRELCLESMTQEHYAERTVRFLSEVL